MAAPKKTKSQDLENKTVLAKAQTVDIPSVVKDIGELQIQIQSALSNLSGALTSKVQRFTETDKAVALAEQRLAELFDIESELMSLDNIKMMHAKEKEETQRERDALTAAWKEAEAERNKKWKREEEEYNYKTKMQNQRALEEFNSEIERQKRAEAVRQEELNRAWNDREAALKAQEDEVKALRDKDATFEARVKNEVARAEAILKNVLEKEHKHTLALLAKEAETNTKLHEGQVASLTSTIESLRAQVTELSEQLAMARADAKEIASTALQSASQKQVAETLTRVVDNQNNNFGKK